MGKYTANSGDYRIVRQAYSLNTAAELLSIPICIWEVTGSIVNMEI
jgi:hypothetical protein